MAPTRQDLLREAETAARRGDLARAAEIYAAILERTPNDLAIRQRLADALARTGRDGEARDVFRRLADDYWNGGYRARALAVLRRAIRLGDPDPELLTLLAERTLEQGLVADAREPLLLAARSWEAAGEGERAARAWRRLAETFPRDVESRRALVRLADADGTGPARARARVQLAEVLARTGDPEGATGAFREALAADREELTALDGLPSLLPPLVEAAPPPGAELFADEDPPVAAGLALLRVSLDHHAGRPADPAPAADLLERDDLPPRAILWAGRVLLDLGDLAGARRGILAGARGLVDRGDEVRDLLIGSLSGLLTRDPGAVEAMELLEELSREPEEGPAPGPAETTGAERDDTLAEPVPPAAPAGEEPEPSPGTSPVPGRRAPDPAHQEARLIEARRLLAHGLADRALAVLDEIAAAGPLPPGAAELRQEVEARLRGSGPDRSVPPPAGPDPIPLGDGTGEDDGGFEIVLDDFDEGDGGDSPAPADRDEDVLGVSGSVPAPVPDPAEAPVLPVPGEGGGERPAPPPPAGGADREPGLDLSALAREVRAAVSGEDAETTFQMGLGLLQMGLVDDGAELLAPVLASPERGWDAALVLARTFLEAGRPAESLEHGMRVLEADFPHRPEVERELLRVLLDAARAAGDPAREESLARRLAALPEPA